jgi:mannitol-1-phosphate 5-dehydrogenase
LRRAVVFGAGKMACGLLGHILRQSRCDVLFVARRRDVVDAITRSGGYRLTLLGKRAQRLAIRGCRACSLQDAGLVVDQVARADVVMTGIGIDHLASVAPLIAQGLWQRSQMAGARPLNVIACENLRGAGAYLRHQIVSAADVGQAMAVNAVGGFAAALTRRIMTGGVLDHGELSFTLSGEPDLVVDRKGLKQPLPQLVGVSFTSEFAALVMRKRFTLNCGQAVAGYLGYRVGCDTLSEAASHPRVAPAVRAAVKEAGDALKARFPHHTLEIERDAARALGEIARAGLGDTVRRVARDPRRKLTPLERLVGPARLAHQHGLPHRHLCLGIAAALAYDEPTDPEAQALQRDIAVEGVEQVLTVDCGLLPHEDLARAVKQQWLRLLDSGRPPAVSPAGAFV